MGYKIKNIAGRLVNLGTRKGKQIFFNAGEEKTLTDEEVNLFKWEIESYIDGQLIIITGKVALESQDGLTNTQPLKKGTRTIKT
jgi:acid phosphatase class B